MNDELAFKLSEAMSAFCRVNLNHKSNLPIRSSEMGILIYISINASTKGVRVVEISEYFGIQKSSVSTIINSLEKQGYIERTTSIEDKRSSPFFVTEKGKHLVDNTFEDYHAISKRVISVIGKHNSEEFLKTLSLVTKIIKSEENEL